MVMIIMLSMLFLMSIQPIVMVVSLMFITSVYSLYIYMMMGSYWLSYALMMVVLSGVMVIFMYMVSVNPNESFEVYGLIFLVLFMFMMFEFKYNLFCMDMSYISLNLWMSLVGIFNLFLVLFLLCIMIMVVWVSWLKQGAVRVM